jgi:mono/diheme cytochrome c family protein
MRMATGALASILFSLSIGAQAQEPEKAAANPGRDLVLQKCAQCHTDAIWRDQRQDHTAWEATAYRMMARGGIWTTDEVKSMAAFLGTEFGPDKPRAKPAQR